MLAACIICAAHDVREVELGKQWTREYHTRTESTVLYVDGSGVREYRYRHLNAFQAKSRRFPLGWRLCRFPVPVAVDTGRQSHLHVDKLEAIEEA